MRAEVERRELTVPYDDAAIDRREVHAAGSAKHERCDRIVLRASVQKARYVEGDEIGGHSRRQMTDVVASKDVGATACYRLRGAPSVA